MLKRKEIRKRLWPNDTVVEFGHSINAVIRKLRQALGDAAESPGYIETVARRGYRLKYQSGWAALSWGNRISDSACAGARETPGFKRPITASVFPHVRQKSI